MKRPAFLVVLCVVLTISIHGHNKICVAPTVGYFLYHSDNALPVTWDSNVKWNYGVTLGYEFSPNDKTRALIQLGYYRTVVSDLFRGYITDNQDLVLGELSPKLVQQSFPCDFSVIAPLSSRWDAGGGITVAATNHALSYKQWFNDRSKETFTSIGAGVCGMIRYTGYAEEQKREWFFEFKLRYVKSIHHFSGGRDLSGYNLDFLQAQVSLGLAYAFHKTSVKDEFKQHLDYAR